MSDLLYITITEGGEKTFISNKNTIYLEFIIAFIKSTYHLPT